MKGFKVKEKENLDHVNTLIGKAKCEQKTNKK
jgi:hypothetical protein